jgi:predicted dehydrogenase/threonine dehydrogenase-like Zn-dependent dehydrogenase
MKQLFQNFKTGNVELIDVPRPQLKSGHLLIHSNASLISAGTERMLLEFGKSSLLSKARQQPDRVWQVLDKVRTDGLIPTLEMVRSRLDKPLPLGYCNAGSVLEVGAGVTGFLRGDRVVSNGRHAEIVQVPKNLCAKIPGSVGDDQAAFTVIGAIGLHGIRLVQPSLGENIVVIGLGLIGLTTVQLLRAHGCQVLGSDFSQVRCDLARQFGAETVDLSKGEDPVEAAIAFSNGRGVDGVLITAATDSNEPVRQAAKMCRKRGRIVLVGVAGLQLNRADFYEKELSFQVSCSYGPGRHEPEYEERGHDYPLYYVRWTEGRNFEAVLNLMAERRVDIRALITHRFQFEDAAKAYDLISQNKEPYLGILLQYSSAEDTRDRQIEIEDKIDISGHSRVSAGDSKVVVGFIGAGDFAGAVLLPALKKTGVQLKTIASHGGASGTHLGKKFGFKESTTNVGQLFRDPEINTVFITTRHNTHSRFLIKALKAGKHVFVEKPLCINQQQLNEIIDTYSAIPARHRPPEEDSGEAGGRNLQSEMPLLMVGFNRRFAPHVVKMKELLGKVNEPKSMVMTVNAGYVPASHWIQDPDVGGGRIIGEGCHFVDLLRFLVGHPITGVQAAIIGPAAGIEVRQDKVSFTLSFADGSLGTVHYLASGHRSFPKERLEVFCAGRILQLQNFKRLRAYGWKGFRKMNLWRQDKGHAAEVDTFIKAIRNRGHEPIPFEELMEVMRVTFQIEEAVA